MPPVLSHKNRQLQVDLTPLVESRLEDTYLTADVASGAGTLTVKDIDGFAIDQYLLIGELGEETSEIIKTHGATAPTGTTITLVANTSFAHAAGTKIYRIEFNQIEWSHADTTSGSKSVLATSNIQADTKTQIYTDTSESSGYYFARYKNAAASTFGSYTDPMPYGGWPSNSVGHLIEQALRNNKETLSNLWSRTDCYDAINAGLRFIQGKQLRFPQYNVTDYVLGQTTRGIRSHTLPTDIYDNDSAKSILGVRIGTDKNLVWKDPSEFEEELLNECVTQVRTQASAADVSLAVDNSYDFADSGSLTFYISGTKYTITYTGVTRDASGSTAAFTGIPASGEGSITVTIPVDTNIYQDPQEGVPAYFTVENGELRYTPMPDATYDNKNVYLDYTTEVTEVDSDGDTLDIQRYDLLVDYLTWVIWVRLKNNSKLDQQNGWFMSFREKMNDMIRTTRSQHVHKMKPKLNRIKY